MVKGGINAQKLISQKVDDWLGSDNEDIIKSQMKLRGVPDGPQDYETRYPETFADLPEETQTAMNEYLSENAKWAHEQGVSKEIYEAFVERDLERTLSAHFEQETEANAQYTKAVEALNKEWGNDVDNNTERAENMAKMLGMEELIPVLKSDPALMKAFHDGAKKLMNYDSIIDGGTTQSLETARDSMNELNDRMMNFRGDTNSGEYQRLVSQMAELQRSLPKTEEDFPLLS
jgi:hypothetical protein